MAYEHKEGRGTLFVNADKKTDKHPDRSGLFKLNGQLYQISGWIQKDDAGNIKKDRDGNPMLSLQVKLRETRAAPEAGRHVDMKDDMDESIPF